ncbi:unnamed protein product [Discosporangium mesarthrocarpum]
MSALEELGPADGRRVSAVAVALSLSASAAEAPWVAAQLRELLEDGSGVAGKEGALLTVQALCEVAGAAAEPHVMGLLPLVLRAHSDAAAPVRTSAAWAAAALTRALNPHGLRVVLADVMAGVEAADWRAKAAALDMTAALARACPVQVASALPKIVPVVSHQVGVV